ASAPAPSPQADGAGAQSAPVPPPAPNPEVPGASEANAPAPPPAPAQPATASAGASGATGTNVVMPQMGESIAEGTIVKWLKKVGDAVQKDEPLFEISTDKVDAEIPSTVAGTLLAIHAQEGETVSVNSVVAVIGEAGAAVAPAPAPAAATPAPAPAQAAPAAPPVAPAPAPAAKAAGNGSVDERRRAKSSPLVRKIAEEHGVNIADVPGTGISGRVTKNDILSYIQHKPAVTVAPAVTAPKPAPAPPAPSAPAPAAKAPAPAPAPAAPAVRAFAPGERVRVEPMSLMRKKIAEHMVTS